MSETPASAGQQNGPVSQRTRPAPSPPRVFREDFDAFYVAEKPSLTAFLMFVGASTWEADDLAHETLIKLLPALWMTIEYPRAWMRKAAYYDYLKQHQRSREDLTDEMPDLPGGICPVSEVELSTQTNTVVEAVCQLPPTQRAVMAFVLDGAGTSEIADTLNMTNVAVRTNLSRARRRLMTTLSSEGGEHDG
ncbi:hypothetical protein GCM10022403_084250 [Streptomyces coacervatus]|uniref:RNA polymerase sigma factor 70 region 4 type 2 domain-containing protein n=1 Tax=Streptomyces coacervatus TaxID=647381 RepID=A0ABP7JBJ8_9ACTN|nr:sigma-70 family RNA polymerase sigma factor [Streptomyces coacervatus]MDF2273359.1 sigma-70 family RNA polymerase sigma factor [Streptomyces coacervatus]